MLRFWPVAGRGNGLGERGRGAWLNAPGLIERLLWLVDGRCGGGPGRPWGGGRDDGLWKPPGPALGDMARPSGDMTRVLPFGGPTGRPCGLMGRPSGWKRGEPIDGPLVLGAPGPRGPPAGRGLTGRPDKQVRGATPC